ncbi:hypothetical protein IH879_21080 [candidate division KSB1 bacterium]|nr:hypothetical protein [candidate division KSB1 bacterium]
MGANDTNKILIISVVLGILLLGTFTPVAGQATPEFLVTWKANTYVPAGYQAKALPIRGSQVEVSFELIDNGKIADLSRSTIRWFINFKLQETGIGNKTFAFTITPYDNRIPSIKILILDYKGAELKHLFDIPIAEPDVVIDTNDQRNFRGLPYFFNVNNINSLDFGWEVNDKKPEGAVDRPDLLSLDIPEIQLGESLDINISLIIKNLGNPLEFASAETLRLTVQ